MHAPNSHQPTAGSPGLAAPAPPGGRNSNLEHAVAGPGSRVVVATVLLGGLVYLVWRTTTIGRGWILLLSLPLLWSEIWSWVQLLLLRYQVTPKRQPGPADGPAGNGRQVTAGNGRQVTVGNGRQVTAGNGRQVTVGTSLDVTVVVGPDTPAAALERTLVGLAVTGWDRPITVLSASDGVEHRRVIDRFTIHRIDRDTGLRLDLVVDEAMTDTPLAPMVDLGPSDWLLWLEAGQVPMPELFDEIVCAPVAPSLAVRQVAVGLLNPNSLFHLRRGGDEEALEREIIGPALATRGVAPWRGPGSLVRRRALREVAAEAPSHWVVSEWAVALHGKGWSTDYDRRPLIRALAPDSLQSYLVTRRDRSVAALIMLGAAFSRRGVPGATRWAATAAGVSLTYGLRQLALLALLVASLLSGRLPFVGDLETIVAAMIGHAACTTYARRRLSAGSMSFGDWTRHGWRTLGADLAALAPTLSPLPEHRGRTRRPARRDALGQLRLLVVTLSVLESAFVARALNTVYPALLPTMTRRDGAVLLLMALVTTYTLVDVLGVLVLHRQRRGIPRIPLDTTITAAGGRGTTLDVTPRGIGALLESAPALGETITVGFSVPLARGGQRRIETPATVRSATRHHTGAVRVGFEFDEAGDDDRIALIEYCALGTPHGDGQGSAGRRPASRSSPDDLAAEVRRGDLRLLRLVTMVATATAVAALFLGPVAGPASADDEAGSALPPESLSVLVPDGENGLTSLQPNESLPRDRQPVVRVHTDAWSEPLVADGAGGFRLPSAVSNWSGQTMVEVAFGPDRQVTPIPADAGVLVSVLRIEAGAGDMELAGPGGRWRAGVDGEPLVAGRYTMRVGSAALDSASGQARVERIVVEPGQRVIVGPDGITVEQVDRSSVEQQADEGSGPDRSNGAGSGVPITANDATDADPTTADPAVVDPGVEDRADVSRTSRSSTSPPGPSPDPDQGGGP